MELKLQPLFPQYTLLLAIIPSVGVPSLILGAQHPLPDDFNPGADNAVYTMAVQTDGRILPGGGFTQLGSAACEGCGRLESNGDFDWGFRSKHHGGTWVFYGVHPSTYSLLIQEDGKILVGGLHDSNTGQVRNNLAQVETDGSLNMAFKPEPNAEVYSLAMQANGKILIGGDFTLVNNQSCLHLARLNNDATLDASFSAPFDNRVFSLAIQEDGKILAGGAFTTVAGQRHPYLVRLAPDGQIDPLFDPKFDAPVYTLMVQPNGQIIVGGWFAVVNEHPRSCIARLNPDGTLDSEFDPSVGKDRGPASDDQPPYVSSMALQTDGRIVIGGVFSSIDGEIRNGIARLNGDGTLDLGFNPGSATWINSLLVQPDGKILIGGSFTNHAGETRFHIARLNNTEPATQRLTCSGSKITWMRGGASPEVWRTSFHYSTNEGNWILLGSGTRIEGGWSLAGANLPPGARIRARGFIRGDPKTSGWFVEAVYGGLSIIQHPMSATNRVGATAKFRVAVSGSEPICCQWFKDGQPLIDGGNIAGALTPLLTVSNVFKRDEGGYHVVVINPIGSVASQPATLTVIEPIILEHPISQARDIGESAQLSVAAIGTALRYQWWKDGSVLSHGTNATLSLTNLQSTDAGYYFAVVSNPYTSLTSSVALLTINTAKVDPDFFMWWSTGSAYSMLELSDHTIAAGISCYDCVCAHPSLFFFMRGGIVRFMTDGFLDRTASTELGGFVKAMIIQPDGKILVLYALDAMAIGPGMPRTQLIRLNVDGSRDAGFCPAFDWSAQAIALQPDGKICVAGENDLQWGMPSRPSPIVRLNPDGTVDTEFNSTISEIVRCLALQPDGKIIVSSSMGGMFRLHADGSLDSHVILNTSPVNATAIAVQPDGKILVAGEFMMEGCKVFRLNSDLTLNAYLAEVSAAPNTLNRVFSLVQHVDGRILVGGGFSRINGQARCGIARLNQDGLLDANFSPSDRGGGGVKSLLIQTDGRIVAATDHELVRLSDSESAADSVSANDTTVTWLRSGAGPEVWYVTFEQSSNGITWNMLGTGSRILGGWQLSGLSLPSAGAIRARGYVTGGQFNGSSWFVERMSTLQTTPIDPPSLGITIVNGKPEIQVTGTIGAAHTIEYATSLSTTSAWTTSSSFVITNRPHVLINAWRADMLQRFYRVGTGK